MTDDVEATVRELSGIVTALELAIKVLIATHPDKRVACATWDSARTKQVEDCMTHPSFANDTQRNAIMAKFADLSWLFEEAAAQEARASHGT